MIAEPLFKDTLTRARVTGHQMCTEHVCDEEIVDLCSDCALAGRAKGRRECPLRIPKAICQTELVHPIQIFAIPAWSSAPDEVPSKALEFVINPRSRAVHIMHFQASPPVHLVSPRSLRSRAA